MDGLEAAEEEAAAVMARTMASEVVFEMAVSPRSTVTVAWAAKACARGQASPETCMMPVVLALLDALASETLARALVPKAALVHSAAAAAAAVVASVRGWGIEMDWVPALAWQRIAVSTGRDRPPFRSGACYALHRPAPCAADTEGLPPRARTLRR